MTVLEKRLLVFVLGLPLIFLGLSIATDNWGFFLWSLLPTFVGGSTFYFLSKTKKEPK